jgi:hypothetical protein
MDQSKNTDTEVLLKGIVAAVKELVAHQDALEAILFDKKIVTDQEWQKALQVARQRIAVPNAADIKKSAKVAGFLETLAKLYHFDI